MALLLRADIDRPYGRQPVGRHILSRLASDLYFPRVPVFGYLRELEVFLDFLQKRGAKGHFFFRRCTLPGRQMLRRLDQEGHVVGLHLENSRSFDTFLSEKLHLERHIGHPIWAFSKHGSGGHRYGWHHYAPYEPERYTAWARQTGMKLFLGNAEDASLKPRMDPGGVLVFPGAFWLEPSWRDTIRFPVSWLQSEATISDVVLLLHPENVFESAELIEDLDKVLSTLPTHLVSSEGGTA